MRAVARRRRRRRRGGAALGPALHEVDARRTARAVGGNPLDVALWDSPARRRRPGATAGYAAAGVLPFDHERRLVSVLVRDGPDGALLITKGAPGGGARPLLDVPAAAAAALEAEFAAGNRVVAVATPAVPRRPVADAPSDERDLRPRRASWSSSTRPSRTPARRCAGWPARHHGQGRHRRQRRGRARRSARDLGLAARRRRSPGPTSTRSTTTRWPPRSPRRRCSPG